MIVFLHRCSAFLTSWAKAAWSAFDVRDFLGFGGLVLFAYGLYLLRPWLGLAVAGGLLMAIGYLMSVGN